MLKTISFALSRLGLGGSPKDALTNLVALAGIFSALLLGANQFWPISPELLKIAEFIPVASVIILGTASGKSSDLSRSQKNQEN